jgi:DNA replication protein DnaC
VTQRDALRVERAIALAKFPVMKELSTFDFSAMPNISKQRVLELAQGGYMGSAETIILIGGPGLGKPQPTIYPHGNDGTRT